MQRSHNRGKGHGIKFLRDHVDYQGDECLIWPLSRNYNGHGNVGFNGRHYLTHRLMCELAHGKPPGPEYEAAHSCGRGHEACVNPRHISWKTRSENQRDRYVHKRLPHRQAQRKLTAKQVGEVRSLAGNLTNKAIAERFGVSRGTIRQILTGELWSSDRRQVRVFTCDEVLEIRQLQGRRPVADLAKEYGASPAAIWRIQARVTYKYF